MNVVATWTPLLVDGCILWLRGDLGVTLVDGAVSAWADQSGQGQHFSQSTTGLRPALSTLGGQSAVVFTGAERLDRAVFAGLGAATDFAAFVVLRVTNVTPGDRYVLDSSPDGIARPVAIVWASGIGPGGITGYALSISGPEDGIGLAAFAMVDAADPHLLCATQVAEQRSLIMDGWAEDTEVLDQSNSAVTEMHLGAALAGFGFVGEVAEVVIYSRIPTLHEVDALEGYFAARYGLVLQ